MKDLNESSRIFEASSRFQSAATAVHKLRCGQALTENDRECLAWSGHFLQAVDRTSNPTGTAGVTGDLSVQATEVRPAFYATLANVEPKFRIAGIAAENELSQFLSSTYKFLGSAGKSAGVKQKDALQLAELLLDALAKALLVRLTGNGIPSETDLPRLSVA